jgi:hypothetical protein
MPLTIDHLEIVCKTPPERQQLVAEVEHLVRRDLPASLGAHLGPSLDRGSHTTVVRRLNVRVRLNQRDWTHGNLLTALCKAFSEALFQALALPAPLGSPDRAEFSSQILWKAEMIAWVENGTPADAWRFDLPANALGMDRGSAAILLLLEDPATLAELLCLLATKGTLTRLLARWDAVALERIFAALAATIVPTLLEPFAPIEAISILERALTIRGGTAGVSFGTRAHALLLFATSGPASPHPRRTFQLLQAARILLEYPRTTLQTLQEVAGAAKLSPAVEAQLRTLLLVPASRWRPIAEGIARIVPITVRDAESPHASIRSEVAGVFLLAPVVLALRWDEPPAKSTSREFKVLLASIFQTALLLGTAARFDPTDPVLDTGASIAGGLGAEPGMRDVRAIIDTMPWAEMTRNWNLDPCSSLIELLEHAAAQLLGALGERIRGFRQAPPAAIARAFVRVPGQIDISNERHLQVVLEPTPYAIALHLSGCDGEMPFLPWLEQDFTILLEGL